MGARVKIQETCGKQAGGSRVGDLLVEYAPLSGIDIGRGTGPPSD